MTRTLVSIVLLLVILSSCSKFEKIRKSPDNEYKYRKAVEYYKKPDFDRASVLFDDVSAFFRGTAKIDTINYYLAKCNYSLGYYTAASEYFKMCYDINPYSPFAEEATFMEGYSYYMDSPNPSLDQTSSEHAIDLFTGFLKKYASSQYCEKARTCIAELQEKLVEKSFRSAKLYYDMKVYKSSIVALKSSLEQFPNTKYREEIMWMVVKSSYLLAENSIEAKKKERYQATLDEYYSFVSEFPTSNHLKEAQKIFDTSEKLAK